jgi:type I restriction enzyme S subunit
MLLQLQVRNEGKLVSHRFPTYVFNHGSSPQFFKYIVMQRWFRKLLENIFSAVLEETG